MKRAAAKATIPPRTTNRRIRAPAVPPHVAEEDRAIYRAISILSKRLRKPGQVMRDAAAVRSYLTLRLADKQAEHVVGLFLDNQHRMIADEILSVGSIDSAAVYPREVVKRALACNAAAVIFAHNHPSGSPEPSGADRLITDRLRQALALIDVRVLDHFVVGAGKMVSFTERGWL